MGTSLRWRSEMWNKRNVVMLGVTVCLLLVAGVTGAALTKTWVEGYITEVEVIDPGKEWMDDQGVMHGRSQHTEETLEGDLDGTLYVWGNYELDLNFDSPSFGDGRMWGTLMFVGTYGKKKGIYLGVWGGPIEDFFLDVDWNMAGLRGFVRTRLKIDNYGFLTPPGTPFIPQVYEGYIISK
jgi:hypothetical protein